MGCFTNNVTRGLHAV